MRFNVGFSNPRKSNPLTEIIYKAQKWNKASHTYVRFFDMRVGKEMVFHAVWPTAHFLKYKDFLKTNKVYEEIEIYLPAHKLFNILYEANGKVYAAVQLLYILFYLWTGIPPRSKDMKKYNICTEVLGMILVELGKIERKDAELLTPYQTYKYFKEIEYERLFKHSE